MSTKFIIFDHIPKCGGTTFKKILQDTYKEHYVDINGFNSLPKAPKNPQGEWCLAGHYAIGALSQYNTSYSYRLLTFLRHPLSRFVSLFNMIIRAGFIRTDIISYLVNDYSHNVYTYWFGNGNLKRAKERLSREDTIFGLTEKFSLSLRAFEPFLDRKLPFTSKSNVNLYNKLELPQSLMNHFTRLNGLDLELYQWAHDTFITRTKKYEENLDGVDSIVSTKNEFRNLSYDIWNCDLESKRNKAREAQKILPELGLTYRFEAQTYRRCGELEQAEQVLRKGEENLPGILLFDLFTFYLSQNKKKESLECLEALDIYVPKPPFDTNVHMVSHYCRFVLSHATWLRNFESSMQALDYIERAITHLAWVTDATIAAYARDMLNNGRQSDCETYLKSNINNYVGITRALIHLLLAECAFQRGDHHRTQAEALTAVDIAPLSSKILAGASTLLISCGQHGSAETILKDALHGLGNAWAAKPLALTLAKLLIDTSRGDDAKKILQNIPTDIDADHSNGHPDIELNIVTLLLDIGLVDVARRRHAKRLEQAPMLEQIDIVLCRKLGMYDKAISYIQNHIAGEPKGAPLHYIKELSATLYENGQIKDAQELINSVINIPKKLIFTELLNETNKICVIRVAPWIFCNYISKILLTSLDHEFSLLTSQPEKAAHLGYHAIYAMPNGYFNFERHRPAISPALSPCKFDASLILTSTASPNDYREVIRLGYDLAHTVYLYSFDQLLGLQPQNNTIHVRDMDVASNAISQK